MDPTIAVSAVALILSAIGAYFTFRGKKAEVRVVDDANLRDDQREFIAVLRSSEKEQRERSAALEKEIQRLRAEIVALHDDLAETREDLAQTRADLAAERAARRAGEAAGAAERAADRLEGES